jgi:hypothetical protein
VLNLREQGLSYNKVASYLNDNGYKTTRGKRFRGAHAHSIIKKKHIRDERLNRDYPPEIQNFSILFLYPTTTQQRYGRIESCDD